MRIVIVLPPAKEAEILEAFCAAQGLTLEEGGPPAATLFRQWVRDQIYSVIRNELHRRLHKKYSQEVQNILETIDVSEEGGLDGVPKRET